MTNKKYEILGQRIKSKMLEKGLTHKDLVEITGVSKGSVSHWISGTSAPTGERLDKLCDALDIDKTELREGKFDNLSEKDSLLFTTKPLNSLNSVKVPLFRKVLDCFHYISNRNEFENMSQFEPDGVEYTEIPSVVLDNLSVSCDDVVILKMTAKSIGGFDSGNIDLFLDTSVKNAVQNGRYFIQFGELKGVRQLIVHPVTGEIDILDLNGDGSKERAAASKFDFELVVHAKAIYAGVPLG